MKRRAQNTCCSSQVFYLVERYVFLSLWPPAPDIYFTLGRPTFSVSALQVLASPCSEIISVTNCFQSHEEIMNMSEQIRPFSVVGGSRSFPVIWENRVMCCKNKRHFGGKFFKVRVKVFVLFLSYATPCVYIVCVCIPLMYISCLLKIIKNKKAFGCTIFRFNMFRKKLQFIPKKRERVNYS